MEFEDKKMLKLTGLNKIRASWSLIRLFQLAMGVFCLGYFLEHPNEWISLVFGLGLCIQAIYGMGCSSSKEC